MVVLFRSAPAAALACFLPLLAAQDAQVHTLGHLLESGFVRIPAGEFMMGSSIGNADEQPARRVRIAVPFEMGKYEVTQAQWESVMRNPHATVNARQRATADVNPSHFKAPERPVENVSWDAVQLFLKALNARDPKHIYRLPAEAEWEYAARAGSAAEEPKDLEAFAWFEANSAGATHPVGQKKPNAWGLYDMFGNVFEWVEDWYAAEAYGAVAPPPDTQSSIAGSYKVYRGCGWLSERKYCRPAYRAFEFPSQAQYLVGFRLVRTAK